MCCLYRVNLSRGGRHLVDFARGVYAHYCLLCSTSRWKYLPESIKDVSTTVHRSLWSLQENNEVIQWGIYLSQGQSNHLYCYLQISTRVPLVGKLVTIWNTRPKIFHAPSQNLLCWLTVSCLHAVYINSIGNETEPHMNHNGDTADV